MDSDSGSVLPTPNCGIAWEFDGAYPCGTSPRRDGTVVRVARGLYELADTIPDSQ